MTDIRMQEQLLVNREFTATVFAGMFAEQLNLFDSAL